MESKNLKSPAPVDSQVQSRPVNPGPGLNAAELANPAGRKMEPLRAAKATLQFHNRVLYLGSCMQDSGLLQMGFCEVTLEGI